MCLLAAVEANVRCARHGGARVVHYLFPIQLPRRRRASAIQLAFSKLSCRESASATRSHSGFSPSEAIRPGLRFDGGGGSLEIGATPIGVGTHGFGVEQHGPSRRGSGGSGRCRQDRDRACGRAPSCPQRPAGRDPLGGWNLVGHPHPVRGVQPSGGGLRRGRVGSVAAHRARRCAAGPTNDVC